MGTDTVPSLAVQVEIKTTTQTTDVGNLQRAADFVHAFILGVQRALGAAAWGGAVSAELQGRMAVRQQSCWKKLVLKACRQQRPGDADAVQRHRALPTTAPGAAWRRV